MELPVYTKEQIEAMPNVDVRTVDPETLRDIQDVVVNSDLKPIKLELSRKM